MNPQAELLYSRGQYREALAVIDLQLQTDPTNAEAFSLRSLCLSSMGDLSAGEREARSALAAAGTCANAHFALAAALYRKSQQGRNVGTLQVTYKPKQVQVLCQAAEHVAEAVSLDASKWNYFVLQSQISFLSRRRADAIAQLAIARQLAPHESDPYCVAARMHLISREPTEALTCIAECLALAPENPEVYLIQANCFAMTGRYKEAIYANANALRLNPQDCHAKAGIIGCMRMRNPLYRLAAKSFNVVSKIPRFGCLPVIILIGTTSILSVRFVTYINPQATTGQMLAWIIMAASAWFTLPIIGNYPLQFTKWGGYLLGRRDILASNALVAVYALTLVAIFSRSSSTVLEGALITIAILLFGMGIGFVLTRKVRGRKLETLV
jgi:tetratricopeptide (TPR) repeat protein